MKRVDLGKVQLEVTRANSNRRRATYSTIRLQSTARRAISDDRWIVGYVGVFLVALAPLCKLPCVVGEIDPNPPPDSWLYQTLHQFSTNVDDRELSWRYQIVTVSSYASPTITFPYEYRGFHRCACISIIESGFSGSFLKQIRGDEYWSVGDVIGIEPSVPFASGIAFTDYELAVYGSRWAPDGPSEGLGFRSEIRLGRESMRLMSSTNTIVAFRWLSTDGIHFGWIRMVRPNTNDPIALFSVHSTDLNGLAGEPIEAGMPPRPFLRFAIKDKKPEISWNAAWSAMGYRLESKPDLALADGWQPVEGVTTNVYSFPVADERRYYRLQKP